MDTVEQFIAQNGIGPVLDALGRIRDADEEAHVFAEEHEAIDEDDWFEFIWEVNDSLSGPITVDEPLPVPRFNYRNVERAAKRYDEKTHTPYSWGELVDAVADETGVDVADISSYLEIFEVERNDHGNITAVYVR